MVLTMGDFDDTYLINGLNENEGGPKDGKSPRVKKMGKLELGVRLSSSSFMSVLAHQQKHSYRHKEMGSFPIRNIM